MNGELVPKRAVLAAAFSLGLAALMAGPSRSAEPPQPPGPAPQPVAPFPPSPPQGDSLGAEWREQQNEARAMVRSGRNLPLERVVEAIRRKTPGRMLDTGIEQGPDGHPVYRVRWAASNGRRIDFLVDAGSGAIISAVGR